MEIAAAADPGEHQFIALFGVSFWGAALNLASQNHRRSYRFYKDPLKRGPEIQGAYNVVEITLPNGKSVVFQLSYVPHTSHWPDPKEGESADEYRRRTAIHVGSKPDLSVNPGDFLAAMEEIVEAFNGPLEIDLDPLNWDQSS